MRRIWVLGLVTVALLGWLSQPAAAALPDPNQLFCQVVPGNGAHPAACGTATAQSSYIVEYTTASTESIAGWTVPNFTVIGGCVANVSYCDLAVPARTFDQHITVTVRYQMVAAGVPRPALGFESASSATATIPAFCGKFFC